jgi:short subunit dehydrogenase-like uncharacterized protein
MLYPRSGLNVSLQCEGIEVIELEQLQLDELASRTSLIINGIGPYHLYSSPVIEASAKAGTHYVGL